MKEKKSKVRVVYTLFYIVAYDIIFFYSLPLLNYNLLHITLLIRVLSTHLFPFNWLTNTFIFIIQHNFLFLFCPSYECARTRNVYYRNTDMLYMRLIHQIASHNKKINKGIKTK